MEMVKNINALEDVLDNSIKSVAGTPSDVEVAHSKRGVQLKGDQKNARPIWRILLSTLLMNRFTQICAPTYNKNKTEGHAN